MTGTKRLLALFLAGGLAACSEATRPTMIPKLPEFAISDAAHEGGTQGFYFLPPMVAQPTFSGSFDADITALNPWIAICDITNAPDNNCGGAGGPPLWSCSRRQARQRSASILRPPNIR